MGVCILFLCLLVETIVIPPTDAVTLPFTDLVGTVTPVKPKLSTESSTDGILTSQLPKVPSNDSILAYYKSQFFKAETSDTKCEFSSPLVLNAISKPISVPKIEGLNKDASKLSDQVNSFKFLPPVVQPLSESSKYNIKHESNPVKSDKTLPFKLSPTLKLSNSFVLPGVKKPSPKYPNINEFASYPYVSKTLKAKLRSSSVLLSDTPRIMPSYMSLPSISSLPTVILNPSRVVVNDFTSKPNDNTLSPVSNLSRKSPSVPSLTVSTHMKNPYGAMTSLNPLYSLPYPLRYNVATLPSVVTPSNIISPNLRTISYADGNYLNIANTLPERSQSSINFSPAFFENANILQVVQNYLNTKSSQNVLKKSLEYPQSKKLRQPIRSDSYSSSPDSSIRNKVKTKSRVDVSIPSSLPRYQSTTPKDKSRKPLNTIPLSHDLSFPEIIPADNVPSFFEFDSPILCDNNLHRKAEYNILSDVNNLWNDVDNFQANVDVFSKIPEFSKPESCIIPIQEIPTDIVFPMTSLPLVYEAISPELPGNIPVVPKVENNVDIRQKCPSSTIYASKLPQSSTSPTGYVNLPPYSPLHSSTSNAVSSLNNVLSDITQKILSSFMSYISSVPKNLATKPNPYASLQYKSKPVYPPTSTYPTTMVFNNKPTVSVLPQRHNTPMMAPINALPASTTVVLEPSPSTLPISVTSTPSMVENMASFADDFSSPSFISYPPASEIISVQIVETHTLTPVQITMLPTASFSDYSTLQPSPLNLPSPMVPSYLDISYPRELSIIKMKSSGKNAKTIERLLKLVFLSELINGDAYVDWDALGTVLALLYYYADN